MARALGFTHQLIEDDEFRGDRIFLRGEEKINFGLCSYLGLADDPRLKEAAIDATTRYGTSYSSSTAYTALPLYGELKARLREMLGAPVVVAASATLAHMAALPVLVRRGDTVVFDALVHASVQAVLPRLRDGGATVRPLGHSDLAGLAEVASATSGRVWYLLDGLYSMNGHTAPAERIRQMLDEHPNLWIYCDDAHGFGWNGTNGIGQFLRRSGWHDRLVMSFGLAKSFGSVGGVIATPDAELIEAIDFTGGPLVFGGPLPPATLGANIASAEIHLSSELPELQSELKERISLVNRYSKSIGLPLSDYDDTPLWFVEIGSALTTASVASSLLQDGFFLNAAAFPAVPRGRAGLRFTVTRYLDPDQITMMLDRLHDARLEYADTDEMVDLTVLEK
ncbi:MAG TPA: aminotransferase class I/II-fold pyridoxal phosphate-dependent enzyme [Acidimicrobiia bacterium]|nr:aminotransferase class I/II-fold pyridoxal phosphate-dependent enzyme [Acidimicrobiia bacterium]